MKNLKNKSNEENAKKKYDVPYKITAILIAICAVLGFVLCKDTIPKTMIIVIAIYCWCIFPRPGD